jgi:hypothetical protein
MDKQVYYRIPEEQANFIEEYAREHNISKNSAISQAINVLQNQNPVVILKEENAKLLELLAQITLQKERI